jgi:hypothetical protein
MAIAAPAGRDNAGCSQKTIAQKSFQYLRLCKIYPILPMNHFPFNPDPFQASKPHSSGLDAFIKSLSPETMARLAQPDEEVATLMNSHLLGLLGEFPINRLSVVITTDQNHLAHLLASAMAYGFFLKSAQDRQTMEKSLHLRAE